MYLTKDRELTQPACFSHASNAADGRGNRAQVPLHPLPDGLRVAPDLGVHPFQAVPLLLISISSQTAWPAASIFSRVAYGTLVIVILYNLVMMFRQISAAITTVFPTLLYK